MDQLKLHYKFAERRIREENERCKAAERLSLARKTKARVDFWLGK